MRSRVGIYMPRRDNAGDNTRGTKIILSCAAVAPVFPICLMHTCALHVHRTAAVCIPRQEAELNQSRHDFLSHSRRSVMRHDTRILQGPPIALTH